MTHVQCGDLYGDDPEPAEHAPAGRLCVPVRPVAHGCAARLFRTPVGARTAVAFTTPARLRSVLGAEQPWTALSEPALRALVRPLGVDILTVDPTLTAAPAPIRPAPAIPAQVRPAPAAPGPVPPAPAAPGPVPPAPAAPGPAVPGPCPGRAATRPLTASAR
ncbi:SAV_915 family protein [Streptomyces showdoensis]|uniref:SAV_915 family protein n=1 Tax=Streptomyces showdoensis TaxID=68268 RepID=UPI001F0A49F5|nr:SAV_915 family protein [Streptomyces showdoensis]